MSRSESRFRCIPGCFLLAGLLIALAFGATSAPANHAGVTLSVSPESDRNPAGTTHTLTASIDAEASEYPVQVDFEITDGPNGFIRGRDVGEADHRRAPDFTCQMLNPTESSCSVSYQDGTGQGPGDTDTIVAWIDHDRDNETVETATATARKSWGQLSAAGLAFLEGPVNATNRRCAGKGKRFNGRLVAIGRLCVIGYRVPSGMEGDLVRDYGALWVQATVRTRRTFCARAVATALRAPRATLTGGRASQHPRRVPRRAAGHAELTVEAPGMEVPARMEQTMLLYRGVTASQWLRRAGGDVARFDWRGVAGRKVAFADGFAYSWPRVTGAPSFPPAAAFGFRLSRHPRC